MFSSCVDWTNSRAPSATSTVPLEKPETLRVRSVVDFTRYAFGCMVAIQGGYRMARGWHYTKLSRSSALLLSFSGMCFVLLLLLLLSSHQKPF